MNSFTQNISIFYALMTRDIKVLRQRLHDIIIDGLILVCVTVLVFGYLLPKLGMPTKLIGPIFLGNSLSFFLASLGYAFATRMVYDLKFDRFIEYFLTLPLPKRWLFVYFLSSFIIETSIVTLPLVTFGIVLLGDNFGPINGSFITFLFIYFLVLLFWALFFLGSSFTFSYQWFKNNMWARRLTPLFMLSPAFFTLKSITLIVPTCAKLMLLNPLTYLIEGLRSSLLGGNDYLPLTTCCIGITVTLVCMAIRLYHGFHQQLDPV
ncbi:MAG TPA: ABC transporter permease [Candidatus Babeliales bacterium]|jgi:ABC-2 type transport system permease protein|nr:ABC transporter permease [Candidatus Babeliales bacterium]